MKYIDLFAGIGALSLPFDELGYENVFVSEIDKFAQKTYMANHPNANMHGDITKIDAKDVPDHDLLLAGFPCQAFSRAGLQQGFSEARGTLFFDIARIVEEKKPAIILLENVPGLLSHDKGNTIRVIIKTLEELGYRVDYQTLNAKDFNLAQSRNRVYIVAQKDNKAFNFPIGPKTKTNVNSILDNNVSDKYMLRDGTWLWLQDKHNNKANGFGYSFVNDKAYTRTITKRYWKDGSEALVAQQNKNPRRMTPTELSRIFGLPKDFIFPCSDTQTYMQLGNSVCVNPVRAIAKAIEERYQNVI